MSALLSARGLAVGHRDRAVLRGIDIDILPGELVALIGVNGGGKTTLLNTLSGALPMVEGKVLLGSVDLGRVAARDRARSLSVVLTGRPQAGMLDVRTVVGIGRQPWTGHFGKLDADDERLVDLALQTMDVQRFEGRLFQDLSDGEAQRVMIARALAQDTPIMLLDEPMAFLDLVNRVRLVRVLQSMCKQQMKGVVFSTHDLQIALNYCDRVWLVNGDRLWTGTTEQARTGGVLDEIFASDGLRFDPGSGSFLAP